MFWVKSLGETGSDARQVVDDMHNKRSLRYFDIGTYFRKLFLEYRFLVRDVFEVMQIENAPEYD